MDSSAAHHANANTAAQRVVSRALMLTALAGLLNTSWRRCRGMHQRRMKNRPASKPEKVQVWEDEGGQNQMPDSPR
jgi:transcriptional regulator of acetoin/glycerol metabolism